MRDNNSTGKFNLCFLPIFLFLADLFHQLANSKREWNLKRTNASILVQLIFSLLLVLCFIA